MTPQPLPVHEYIVRSGDQERRVTFYDSPRLDSSEGARVLEQWRRAEAQRARMEAR